MKPIAFLSLMLIVGLSSCTTRETTSANLSNIAVSATDTKARTAMKQFKLTTQSKYPTVGLNEYTLITDDLERNRPEAEAAIQTKIELPHAMQTKERKDFESILSKNYVFRGPEEFYDRDGYINNRVGDPSRVKQAVYRNVVVQFVGDRALITYSNLVEDEPGGKEVWDMTWADVLIKEDGQWKYEVVHLIEFKILPPSESVK